MIPMPNNSKMSELGGISGLAELAPPNARKNEERYLIPVRIARNARSRPLFAGSRRRENRSRLKRGTTKRVPTDPYPALFIRVAAMLCWELFSW